MDGPVVVMLDGLYVGGSIAYRLQSVGAEAGLFGHIGRVSFVYIMYAQVKTGGGVSFNATCKLTKIDEKMIRMILNEYSMWS